MKKAIKSIYFIIFVEILQIQEYKKKMTRRGGDRPIVSPLSPPLNL